MTRALTIFAALIALAGAARAEGTVGVVVTGEPSMQPQVKSLIEGWLTSHGHQVTPSVLAADATAKLVDCFVLEDTSCARKLVEDKATSSKVVVARVDVGAGAAGQRDVTLTGYWFEKGSEPVAEKRVCDRCSDTNLVMAGDELMSALLGSANVTVGQLKLTSNPTGAQVVIDGKPAGATPLDLTLPAGTHQLSLSADGRSDAAKTVTIVKGQPTTLEVALPLPLPPRRPSKKAIPLAVIGAGGALLVTGIVLYATSETDTGEKPEYRDTRALGAGVAIGGLVVGGLGVYLLVRAGRPAEPAPPVSMSIGRSGATLAWRTSF